MRTDLTPRELAALVGAVAALGAAAGNVFNAIKGNSSMGTLIGSSEALTEAVRDQIAETAEMTRLLAQQIAESRAHTVEVVREVGKIVKGLQR